MEEKIQKYDEREEVMKVENEELAWRVQLMNNSDVDNIAADLEEDFPEKEVSVEVGNCVLVLKD